MSNQREDMNIVIVGHVDHGKSTIIGRLLADTKTLPEGKLEQVKEMCRRTSRPFEYAFLLDALKDEQAQGITIDSARAFFKTVKRDYIIIDAPGHIEFLKNMVSGAARAEAALLVIDAKEGVRENSKRHGYLLSMLGIKQVAVLINKMDLISYNKDIYSSIVEEYSGFLNEINVTPKCFIPVSGMQGDNIASLSEKMDWYLGDTVLSLLDSFDTTRSKEDLPFRMPVQGVYKFTQNGDDRRIISGTIDSGRIKKGDPLTFYPSGKKSKVKSLERFNTPRPEVLSAGEAVGFTLDEQIYVRRGDLACLSNEPKPKITTRIKTNIFWLGKNNLIIGKKYFLKLGTAKVGFELEEILRIIDAADLTSQEKERIERNDVAEVILKTEQPIAFDLARENELTSRIVIVDQYEIAGGGIITEALEDDVSWIRNKVQLRNEKWYTGYVSFEQRAERYNQKPVLILVTGKKEVDRKAYAAELERRLFKDGKFVYFLTLGNFIYGVNGDIIAEEKGHNEEHFRRLAEFANIMLSTGQILIISAQEIQKRELEIIKTIIDAKAFFTFWVGEDCPDEKNYDLICADENKKDFSYAAKEYLQKRGIVFKYDF